MKIKNIIKGIKGIFENQEVKERREAAIYFHKLVGACGFRAAKLLAAMAIYNKCKAGSHCQHEKDEVMAALTELYKVGAHAVSKIACYTMVVVDVVPEHSNELGRAEWHLSEIVRLSEAYLYDTLEEDNIDRPFSTDAGVIQLEHIVRHINDVMCLFKVGQVQLIVNKD